MLSDPKYIDNIILQKDAMQDLLTNIKNYPIIDIDNVTEDETDEETGLTIWPNYTDGTPCIKITYGDESTTKGNIIFAEIFKKLKAKVRRKKISLGNETAEYTNQLGRWKKVYDQNKAIYDKRSINLQNYINGRANEAVSTAANIVNTIESLRADHNTTFDKFWDNQYYPYIQLTSEDAYDNRTKYYQKNSSNEYEEVTNNINETNWTTSIDNGLYVKNEIYPTYEKTHIIFNTTDNYTLINSSIPYDYLATYYIKNTNNGYDEYEYTTQTQWEQDLSNNKIYIANCEATFPTIRGEARSTVMSQLLSWINLASSNEELKEAYQNIYNEISTYPTYEQMQNGQFSYIVNNNGTYSIDSNSATPATIYEYVKEYLKKVVNSAEVKMDNAYIIWQYYVELVGNTQDKINALDYLTEKIDELINLIASSEYTIKDPTISTNITYSIKNEPDNFITTYISDENLLNSEYKNILTQSNALNAVSSSTSKIMYGYKYVKVGSNIIFKDPNGNNIQDFSGTTANYGTFHVNINGHEYEVPIKGFENSTADDLIAGTNIKPSSTTNTIVLGSNTTPWDSGYINNIYANNSSTSTVGTSTTPYGSGYFNQITIGTGTNAVTIGGSGNTGDAGKILRGDGKWSDTIVGSLNFNTSTANNAVTNVKISNNNNDGIKQGSNGANGFNAEFTGTYVGDTTASIYTAGGIYAAKNIIATKVFNAVFNDYAECRQTIMVGPGYTVIDQDNGIMIPSTERLQPGAQIVSDTYGHLMGQTDEAKTPIAVAGRVLAYTYRPREEYHAGMAVCSAPGGTVDIMTREEIRDYPDCIVGIVSEIPQYERWGSDNVAVNGRIWIKVR